MFRKILVSIDNSQMSTQVFERAVFLAKCSGASLMLLHVLFPSDEVDEDYIEPLFIAELQTETDQKNLKNWQELKQSRENWLRSLCQSANSSGVKTEFILNTGEPSRMICQMARSWDADLIVIGRRGRRGLSEFFLGSVSNYVLHHAPCSVMTIQSPTFSTTETSQNQELEV